MSTDGDDPDGGGADRPNVLLLFADQFRYDCLGASGNDLIATPNLDALAASGTRFDRAYTESPVCVPARASVLTGALPHRTGVVDNDTPLPAGTPTVASVLADAGYHTEAIGKMHFEPVRTPHGFQNLQLGEEIPAALDEDDYLQELVAAGYGWCLEPNGVRHELYYHPQPSQLPEHLHSTAWVARRTSQFLQDRDPDRPFFCWSSFIQPHPPFDPPAPRYLDYDPLDMPDPVRDPIELDRLGYHAFAQHRVKWTKPDEDLGRIRTMRAYYYACVSFVDWAVGEIVAELERQGLRENTLILFAADHGEYLGDHWSFGKRGFHDAAARIPLLMSRPGQVPAQQVSSALVGLTDLAPTILSAAGVSEHPLQVDGGDLAPVARRDEDRVREHYLGQYQRDALGIYCLADDKYKYVWSAPDDRESLFAMTGPAGDCVDLADDPDHAHTLARLRTTLIARLRSDGYESPLDGDGWRRFPRAVVPGTPDDRDPTARGRQYPLWAAHE